MREINREIVSAVLISKDNKIFVAKYSQPGGVYPDCWHIPGGGIEDGEGQITALKREIMEEVGLDIQNCNIELIDNEEYGDSEKILRPTREKVICHMHFNNYKVDINLNADEIKIHFTDDEFNEFQWVKITDVKNLNITPPSIKLFKKMGYIKD